MTRGSALLISSSSWSHTDLQLHPKAWRELWWCEDSDVSAVQAWPALSGANQLCCDKTTAGGAASHSVQKAKKKSLLWFFFSFLSFFFLPPVPSVPALRSVHCTFIWCCLVLKNHFKSEGGAVWFSKASSMFSSILLRLNQIKTISIFFQRAPPSLWTATLFKRQYFLLWFKPKENQQQQH